MFKHALFGFLFVTLQTACQTSGTLDLKGFSHNQMGYQLSYQNDEQKTFLNDIWKLDADDKGRPKHAFGTAEQIETKSQSGKERSIQVEAFDLFFRNLETNGVISIQSFPLGEGLAQKKLDIMAKDFAETVSGQYFAAFGSAYQLQVGKSKNWVTTVVSGKFSVIDGAESYESTIEVANADQIKLNPADRARKYKLILIRPKIDLAWHEAPEYDTRLSKKERIAEQGKKEHFPGMIALLYAMDYPYYENYLKDFDGLVARLKLRHSDH